MKPLVSIVMPCYNGERYIRSAIKSVQAQTLPDWELLIVQNNSTDRSRQIVRTIQAEDSRIRDMDCLIPGAAAARNYGIDVAQGRYIAFLDCDDEWLPNKLELQIELLTRESAAFSWGSYEVIDGTGKTLRIQRSHAQTSYRDLLFKRKVIGCLTAIYDSHQFGKLMMPQIKMRQDYGLFLELLRIAEQKGLRAIGLEQCIARYRVHGSSMTQNKLAASYYQWQLYRRIEKLSLPISLAAMSSYIVCGLKDHA